MLTRQLAPKKFVSFGIPPGAANDEPVVRRAGRSAYQIVPRVSSILCDVPRRSDDDRVRGIVNLRDRKVCRCDRSMKLRARWNSDRVVPVFLSNDVPRVLPDRVRVAHTADRHGNICR